jgi:diguanylate cyclase (GGDEF)-like protein
MNKKTTAKKKNSVLLVDDSQFSTCALKKILDPEYIIYVASNGKTAINMAAKHSPDVILLDIIMSGMDGFEVISELKNTPETREIPVIFLTGLDSSEDEEKGLALNAADYISKPFSPAVVKLRVRNQVQIVNYIRTIQRLGLFDTLTELPNRLSFNEKLDKEWNKAISRKNPIGILMMDLDKFKLYNDTYGHVQGDILLRSASKIFKKTLTRAADFVARWGGEEFVVLLPGADEKRAAMIAENIRANIESLIVSCADGTPTGTTISIGANSIIPDSDSSADLFITQADTVLYEAKKNGRNRVCFYEHGENL